MKRYTIQVKPNFCLEVHPERHQWKLEDSNGFKKIPSLEFTINHEKQLFDLCYPPDGKGNVPMVGYIKLISPRTGDKKNFHYKQLYKFTNKDAYELLYVNDDFFGNREFNLYIYIGPKVIQNYRNGIIRDVVKYDG